MNVRFIIPISTRAPGSFSACWDSARDGVPAERGGGMAPSSSTRAISGGLRGLVGMPHACRDHRKEHTLHAPAAETVFRRRRSAETTFTGASRYHHRRSRCLRRGTSRLEREISGLTRCAAVRGEYNEVAWLKTKLWISVCEGPRLDATGRICFRIYAPDAFFFDPGCAEGPAGRASLAAYFTKLLSQSGKWEAVEVFRIRKGFTPKWRPPSHRRPLL